MDSQELEVRVRVRILRAFYRDLAVYAVTNVALVLIWAFSGHGFFWPIFVMAGWGVGLVFKAVDLGLMPLLQDWLPFLSQEWEDEQVKRQLRGEGAKNTAYAGSPKKEKKQG